VYKRQ